MIEESYFLGLGGYVCMIPSGNPLGLCMYCLHFFHDFPLHICFTFYIYFDYEYDFFKTIVFPTKGPISFGSVPPIT